MRFACLGGVTLETQTIYDAVTNAITLSITNRSASAVVLNILDAYSRSRTSQAVDAGKSVALKWQLASTFGWYDFVITVDSDPLFENRIAGHVETGQNSFSDPLMGAV